MCKIKSQLCREDGKYRICIAETTKKELRFLVQYGFVT